MPVWIDEIYAHKFANLHGGSPSNTPYYNSFVGKLADSKYSRQITLGDTDTYIISEYNDRAKN